jgi:protein ImuB
MLLDDLSRRLDHFGLPARLAIADTAGTAWALSHFHPSPAVVLPSGQQAEALAPLPIEALRLSPDTRTPLRRLGFKRIGSVLDKPRAPFAARFSAELLQRLDQALGRVPEPLSCIAPLPAYHHLRQLLEPIKTQEAIVAVTIHLMEDLVPALVRDGVGARALQLVLYRIDGEVRAVDIGLTMPTRSPAHVARLVALKLERIAETIDAGFGFEALSLAVTVAERMEPRQTELTSTSDPAGREERCAALIDSLGQRLGPRKVRRLKPIASHLPERAETRCVAIGETPAWPASGGTRPRPILMFHRAEPADVIALVPEGPPQRFRWRGVMHAVAHARGPERIASEWWRGCVRQPTRDYYFVEDEIGRRFWLYREGLYGRETVAPRWFVHGMFA